MNNISRFEQTAFNTMPSYRRYHKRQRLYRSGLLMNIAGWLVLTWVGLTPHNHQYFGFSEMHFSMIFISAMLVLIVLGIINISLLPRQPDDNGSFPQDIRLAIPGEELRSFKQAISCQHNLFLDRMIQQLAVRLKDGNLLTHPELFCFILDLRQQQRSDIKQQAAERLAEQQRNSLRG